MCVLCLLKLNVILSLLVAAMVAGLTAGMDLGAIMGYVIDGLNGNGTNALAYLLLGTFAAALTDTGLATLLGKWIASVVKERKWVLLITFLLCACISGTLVPIHIAYIPILYPPLLHMMNKMKMDRRQAACVTECGLVAMYVTIPIAYGSIFQGIIADNMTANGMETSVSEVSHYNWMLGCCMLVGLLIAVFVTYRKPREYKMVAADTAASDAASDRFTAAHAVTLVAILGVVVVQVLADSLALAALTGVAIMIVGGAVKWNKIDEQFDGGVRIMGLIGFIMLVAGGYAEVMKATGAVNELVEAAIAVMGGNKWVAATVITLIGLLVTMGIGSSFSTVPVVAILYVPLCQRMGFSIPATIILMSAAAALGDAGSPASDTTLGPTAGLNADGQHNHIWDTCVPTFLHYNIPLMIGAIVLSQFV